MLRRCPSWRPSRALGDETRALRPTKHALVDQAPEDTLGDETRAAKSKEEARKPLASTTRPPCGRETRVVPPLPPSAPPPPQVQAAVDKALAAGARKGSPALNAAEKVLKAADKSWEDAEKAKPKPPKK